MVDSFYRVGAYHHPGSYVFLCKKCGLIYGRISTEGDDNYWSAIHSRCKTCGGEWTDGADMPGITYVHAWDDEVDELKRYPVDVLTKIFLHELTYYEAGK